MFIEIIGELALGFLTTLELFALTLVFTLPLGLLVAFCTMSRFYPLRMLFKLIVWVVRGTPLMLQLLIIFYGPGLLGLPAFSNRFLAAVIAFVINYACYFSEIYRGGIQSISKGQYEAGQVLGMTRSQIFMRVVLLQVIRRVLAPMSNEVMTLVKDTSLANTISVIEIIRVATTISSTYAVNIIFPILYAGVFYLAFIGILTLLFGWLEKKLNYFRV